jgi:hypothetical protein
MNQILLFIFILFGSQLIAQCEFEMLEKDEYFGKHLYGFNSIEGKIKSSRGNPGISYTYSFRKKGEVKMIQYRFGLQGRSTWVFTPKSELMFKTVEDSLIIVSPIENAKPEFVGNGATYGTVKISYYNVNCAITDAQLKVLCNSALYKSRITTDRNYDIQFKEKQGKKFAEDCKCLLEK